MKDAWNVEPVGSFVIKKQSRGIIPEAVSEYSLDMVKPVRLLT